MLDHILTDWKAEYVDKFGQSTLYMHHRLADSGLFTRDALADLIDSIPSERYNINTMGYDPQNPVWREGIIEGSNGAQVIDAIERGRMWLNVRKLQELDSRYEKLLQAIYDELEALVPGFETFKQNLGLLISSPKVQVFYHADIPGQSLWQLTGEKRVYIYPNTEDFLPQKALEGIILGDTEEEIPYMAKFDDHAEVYDLKPGEMLNWALNGPHRVENADCLNVSVTTEHWTSSIRKSYAVNYANGVLRKKLGLQNLSRSTSSPMVYPKAALAMAWRKLELNKKDEFKRMIDFVVDPDSETGMRDIEARAK